MDQYKKVAKNIVFFALGTFGSKLISFFLVPLYTSVLVKEAFGKMDVFYSTINLLVPFVSLILPETVLRFSLDQKENKKEILTNAFLGILFFYIIFIISSMLFLKIDLYLKYKFLFKSILLVSILNELFALFTKSINKVFWFSLGGILSTFLTLILNIYFLIFLKIGVEGIFYSWLISGIISLIYYFIVSESCKYIVIRLFNLSKLKEMLFFSIPLIPNVMNWWVINVSDRYLLTYFIGYDATGLYSVSYKLPTILTVINLIFYQAWQISAIENDKSENRDRLYSNLFKVNMGLILLSTSGILIMLKPFMRIYVAEDYFIAYKYAPFLLIGTVFSAFSIFFGVGYLTSKKTIQAFTTSVIGSIVNIVVNILFIPKIGIQAAAISTLLSFLVMWLARVYQTRKFYKINIDLKKFIPALLVVFIQSYLVIATERNSTLFQFLLFASLLLIFIKEEKIMINKGVKFIKEFNFAVRQSHHTGKF